MFGIVNHGWNLTPESIRKNKIGMILIFILNLATVKKG
jgi:hypothetical protein